MDDFDLTDSVELLISQTADLLGHDLTAQSIKIMADDLMPYEYRSVMTALIRCRRECKYRLTLNDILERLPEPAKGQPTGSSPITDDVPNDYDIVARAKVIGDMDISNLSWERAERLYREAMGLVNYAANDPWIGRIGLRTRHGLRRYFPELVSGNAYAAYDANFRV